MSKFKGSKGNWSIGRTGSCVVTDDVKGFKKEIGHADVDYYGGALICESIYKIEDAKLIAAAPDLLAACQQLIDSPHYEHFAVRLNDHEMKGLEMIKEAIKKATE